MHTRHYMQIQETRHLDIIDGVKVKVMEIENTQKHRSLKIVLLYNTGNQVQQPFQKVTLRSLLLGGDSDDSK